MILPYSVPILSACQETSEGSVAMEGINSKLLKPYRMSWSLITIVVRSTTTTVGLGSRVCGVAPHQQHHHHQTSRCGTHPAHKCRKSTQLGILTPTPHTPLAAPATEGPSSLLVDTYTQSFVDWGAIRPRRRGDGPRNEDSTVGAGEAAAESEARVGATIFPAGRILSLPGIPPDKGEDTPEAVVRVETSKRL